MANTLRSCIIAEEGYTFIAADASQIELRVLAILSKDPQMLEDLKTGDLHMATAVRMFGYIDDPDTMESRRYMAKQGNFALVYGADAFKLSQMLDCSIEEAEDFMSEHKRSYPTLYRWMEAKRTQAKQDGYVTTMFGRIRYIPDLKSTNWKLRERALMKVVNTIVQGSAVDIVKRMMLYMRMSLDKSIRLVLQVHDEMVFELPMNLLQNTIEEFRKLSTIFPDYPISIKTGKAYGELANV